MKFNVSRMSDKETLHGRGDPPLAEAVNETVHVRGRDQLNRPCVSEAVRWVIDVPDLQTLVDLAASEALIVYAPLVIETPAYPTIRIYDDHID